MGKVVSIMPIKRVTMQDIADACGLSRNTVSKVFNNRGAVPPPTRSLILQKAKELGYGIPGQPDSPPQSFPVPGPAEGNSIALLTCNMPVDYHFGTYFVTAFTDQICRAGYTLKMFELSGDELRQKRLPPHFSLNQTAGIVGIELFDRKYMDFVCALGLPTIFVDGPAYSGLDLLPCDIILMENWASNIAVISHLASLGAKYIGFCGDKEHCCSFSERWMGYKLGLQLSGLPLDEKLCITEPDSSPYNNPDWLISRFDRMPRLPDAMVCANDYLAVHVMNALKKKGLSVPDDVMITGFDGTSQSALVEPPLTTVQIPSVDIGRMAAETLLSRIRNPALPYSWTHVRTTPVWRRSTQGKK